MTTEQILASREAFEKHTRTLPINPNDTWENLLRRKPNGKYAEPSVYSAFEGWQACDKHWREKGLEAENKRLREALSMAWQDLHQWTRYAEAVHKGEISNTPSILGIKTSKDTIEYCRDALAKQALQGDV